MPAQIIPGYNPNTGLAAATLTQSLNDVLLASNANTNVSTIILGLIPSPSGIAIDITSGICQGLNVLLPFLNNSAGQVVSTHMVMDNTDTLVINTVTDTSGFVVINLNIAPTTPGATTYAMTPTLALVNALTPTFPLGDLIGQVSLAAYANVADVVTVDLTQGAQRIAYNLSGNAIAEITSNDGTIIIIPVGDAVDLGLPQAIDPAAVVAFAIVNATNLNSSNSATLARGLAGPSASFVNSGFPANTLTYTDFAAATLNNANIATLNFGGVTDGAHTVVIGAAIQAASTQVWSAGNTGTLLRGYTTPNNSSIPVVAWTAGQDGSFAVVGPLSANAIPGIGNYTGYAYCGGFGAGAVTTDTDLTLNDGTANASGDITINATSITLALNTRYSVTTIIDASLTVLTTGTFEIVGTNCTVYNQSISLTASTASYITLTAIIQTTGVASPSFTVHIAGVTGTITIGADNSLMVQEL